MSDKRSSLVYSTDKIVARGKAPSQKSAGAQKPASKEGARVRLERKGRGGKTVTLIEGLHMPAEDGALLMKKLKTRLGTGGTFKDDIFEIQGDHREMIMVLLQDMGYKAKRAGG